MADEFRNEDNDMDEGVEEEVFEGDELEVFEEEELTENQRAEAAELLGLLQLVNGQGAAVTAPPLHRCRWIRWGSRQGRLRRRQFLQE